jgi:hypothetical protein
LALLEELSFSVTLGLKRALLVASAHVHQERSVTVTRCNERVFGAREWKLLEENLAVWNSSLTNMISEAFPQP